MEDTLTISRELSLYKQWGKHPPTHWLAAAYMGVGGKNKKRGDVRELQVGTHGG